MTRWVLHKVLWLISLFFCFVNGWRSPRVNFQPLRGNRFVLSTSRNFIYWIEFLGIFCVKSHRFGPTFGGELLFNMRCELKLLLNELIHLAFPDEWFQQQIVTRFICYSEAAEIWIFFHLIVRFHRLSSVLRLRMPRLTIPPSQRPRNINDTQQKKVIIYKELDSTSTG